jgi:multidrug resistance efflux pump
MVAEWMAAVAASAGYALVGAITTDTWGTARALFSRLFAGDDTERREVVESRLDATATELEGADSGDRERVAERLAQAWTVRLVDLLEERPDEAPTVREIAERLHDAVPGDRRAWIRAAHTGSVIQHGTGPGTVANTGVVVGGITIDRRKR